MASPAGRVWPRAVGWGSRCTQRPTKSIPATANCENWVSRQKPQVRDKVGASHAKRKQVGLFRIGVFAFLDSDKMATLAQPPLGCTSRNLTGVSGPFAGPSTRFAQPCRPMSRIAPAHALQSQNRAHRLVLRAVTPKSAQWTGRGAGPCAILGGRDVDTAVCMQSPSLCKIEYVYNKTRFHVQRRS